MRSWQTWRPWSLILLSSTVFLTACDLSPDYQLPELFGGAAFKEDAPSAVSAQAPEPVPAGDIPWVRVDEKANIDETAWWRLFQSPELNALEEQALKDSPALDVALARMRSARGFAGIAESALYPKVGLGATPERQKPAAAAINGSFPSPTPFRTKPYTTYTAQGTIGYELDLFGMNRNTARAAERDAEAEAQNYRATRLALEADVAQAYFQYAALRAEQAVLTRSLATRREALKLTRQQRDIGTIDDLTFSTAQTDVATVEADSLAVTQQLATVEHMLAALLGVTPAQFTPPNVTLAGAPPSLPNGLPSTMLERRPDVQAAAKQIAAANARIGAARAGYFPNLTLGAAGGYSSNLLGKLFQSGNDFWSLGPVAGLNLITQPIFEGGRLSATLAQRNADYEGAVANYRAVVLQAFRETEDNLSGVRNFREQSGSRTEALAAAKRAYTVAKQRYEVGYSSHLDFLDAERSYLIAQRSDVQLRGQRYVTLVQLIRALGGSWVVMEPGKAAPVPAPAKPLEAPAPQVSLPKTLVQK